jgi:hypothetical protein
MDDPYVDIVALCEALAASINANERAGIEIPDAWRETLDGYTSRLDGESAGDLIENGVDVMARYLTTH